MLASVIIPCYNRQNLVKRAYESVIQQKNSELVEVIIVDDCSEEPIFIHGLREQDILIRLEKNSGGAVARNVGLDRSSGKLIYFLDSDDYFIERDFFSDNKIIGDSEDLFFCQTSINSKIISSPISFGRNEYFNYIFFKYEGVANTCSIVFNNSKNIRFDNTLPKHQDWDFVYFNFVLKGRTIKRIGGLTCVDRSDKNSISRARSFNKSLPWLIKMKKNVSEDDYKFIEYHILGDFPEYYGILPFFVNSFKYIFYRKSSVYILLKKFVKRIVL